MLEHMKNYDMVLAKVSSWLKDDGRMMVQILGNRRFAYDFKTTDWMGKYFFAGGTMPSRDLFEHFLPADLKQARVGRRRPAVQQDPRRLAGPPRRQPQTVSRDPGGGPTAALIALERWRMFLLFCSEVFGYREGNEWMVFHYLFEKAELSEKAGPVSPLTVRGAGMLNAGPRPAARRWSRHYWAPRRPSSCCVPARGRTPGNHQYDDAGSAHSENLHGVAGPAPVPGQSDGAVADEQCGRRLAPFADLIGHAADGAQPNRQHRQ